MAVELNYTIVPAHDPPVSAQFLADILGLPVDPPLAHVRDPDGHLVQILTSLPGEPA